MVEGSRTPWRITGEETASCNCAWGCPCQFNALPTHGRCEALVGVRIHRGHHGDVTLDGLTFAGAFWFPGPIHEGKGIGQFFIDERARPEQRSALVRIVTGKDGGMPWEIFSAVTETYLEPIIAPIELESNRETRRARLNVPNLAGFQIEPIKNPVTGEEHRAQIRLPDGFEYKEAEMGNSVVWHAQLADKAIRNENSYAQLAAVDWSNT